jgi:hypothetical protein
MKSFNEYKNNNQSLSSFFGNLLSFVSHAHIFHLSTKSYSEHKALDGFYDDLKGLSDSFIETYQGQYGIVKIEQKLNNFSSSAELLKGIIDEVKDARQAINKEDTHLHNILDEITASAYKTLYKINNLK